MSIIGSGHALLLASEAAAAVPTEISRSLRFNGNADSSYLNRTPASAGNRKTWTWAGWIKRSKISDSVDTQFFSAGTSGASNLDAIGFTTADTINFYSYNGSFVYLYNTSAVFRDTSAWYHVVAVLDTTNATSTDRVRLYVNGVRVTVFASSTAPSQNADGAHINTTNAHYTGKFIDLNQYFNGCLADVHFLDGITPGTTTRVVNGVTEEILTDFGEFDATTGVWNPIEYTGSHGANGFHLTFSDNSGTSSTTLGKDAAGSNNWTPNNFSVASGPGNDSLVDVPTNGTQTDTGVGGEVRGNYATLNPLDKNSSATLTNGNLDYDAAAGAWRPVRATTGIAGSGKWYWEVLVGPTAAVLGIETQSTSLANDYYPGIDATGYGYIQTGVTYNNGSSTSYGNSFTSGDLIGVAFDADNGKIWFSKNGTWQNSGNPATGTNAAYTGISASLTYFPTLAFNGSGTSSINFGARAFSYSAPSGFKALCTASLPTPTIEDGSAYMDVALYTGNGSTQTISGLGFSPDLAVIKRRSASENWTWTDTVRGATKAIYSNLTNAEGTDVNGLTAFNSDGFNLGTDSAYNASSSTYAAFCWDAGSSTVSNTDGSITSQVRAQPSAGFSIVTYTTDTSSANQTIGHGLGAQPKLIIIKARNQAYNWDIYHAGISNAKDGRLIFTTAAFSTANAPFGTVDPTSSVFTMYQTSYGNNVDCVAYCFAPVAGYSAFGSYVGNGSSTGDGPFVFTGMRPQWIMVKCSSSDQSGNAWWLLYDGKRVGYNSDNKHLGAQASDAEYTANSIDILSNGFKIRDNNTSRNANGATYVYACFAESPFKYARAR